MAKAKVKNIFDLVSACRKHSMSKDETRSYLMGVYFDKEEKVCVSTNGHILTKSKILYCDELAGLIVMPDYTVNKREFPKWQGVIPSKCDFEAVFSIEAKHILKGKIPQDRTVYFKGRDVSQGEISLERTMDFDFALDSEFLKPLVGHALKFGWNQSCTKQYNRSGERIDDKFCPSLSPVIVRLGHEFGENYNEEIYIIMPIKAECKE